jgi:hypothetical protein
LSYNSKIVAVLGNGPSRKFYDPSKEYNYRLGCNIPWADVDATTALDENIIDLWSKDYNLIKVPTFFSEKAWQYADQPHFKQFKEFILEKNFLVKLIQQVPSHHESSGNTAARMLVELGYTNIDIYGCDAYFTETHGWNTQSYTRNWITGVDMVNNSYKWKLCWDRYISEHPEVTFNFIKG